MAGTPQHSSQMGALISARPIVAASPDMSRNMLPLCKRRAWDRDLPGSGRLVGLTTVRKVDRVALACRAPLHTRAHVDRGDLRRLQRHRRILPVPEARHVAQHRSSARHYNEERWQAALGYLPPAENYRGDPAAGSHGGGASWRQDDSSDDGSITSGSRKPPNPRRSVTSSDSRKGRKALKHYSVVTRSTPRIALEL
jgi:hypothetical protein